MVLNIPKMFECVKNKMKLYIESNDFSGTPNPCHVQIACNDVITVPHANGM